MYTIRAQLHVPFMWGSFRLAPINGLPNLTTDNEPQNDTTTLPEIGEMKKRNHEYQY